jgi:hypothetical protein
LARYFLHLRDGVDEIIDPEGKEFETMEALREYVLIAARDLMTGDIRNGLLDFRFRIDAENESGQVVYSMPFAGALNVIPHGK